MTEPMLRISSRWAEIVQGVRERADEDAKEVRIWPEFIVNLPLLLAMSDEFNPSEMETEDQMELSLIYAVRHAEVLLSRFQEARGR